MLGIILELVAYIDKQSTLTICANINMNKKIRFQQEQDNTIEGVFMGIDSHFHAILNVDSKHITYESGIVCL